MHKTVVALILSFCLLQLVKAQDSTLYYIKTDRIEDVEIVPKDSAEYLMYIIGSPPKPNEGGKRTIKEFYINSKIPRLTGKANIHLYEKSASLYFDGPVTEYYPNGHPEKIINYNGVKPVGTLTEFFTSGNVYDIKKHKNSVSSYNAYREDPNFYLIECHDTTGKLLAEKGYGHWLKLDMAKRHLLEEGQVADGLEEGEWKGYINDTLRYHRIYHKGIISPTTDTAGQVYLAADRDPEFMVNNMSFQTFLALSILYPRLAKENGVQGKVYVTFTIEKDGSLTNVKAIRGPDQSLKDEAERCIKLSPPWVPAMIDHKPVRFQYTVPVSFNLYAG